MLLGHEKVSFLNLPTPIDYLENISRETGIELYLKRDDLTCLGTGGNKLRKLEYLLKEALDQGATALITTGGAQTNHGRLTAAVAARFGLKSAIVTTDEYPGELSANLLLDGILGCEVYLDNTGISREEAMEKVAKEWEAKGEKPYLIPVGGSNDIGMLGYYECALEIADQVRAMGLEGARVVTTCGSLGTYMGLAAAVLNEDLPFRLTGIAIEPFKDAQAKALRYYNSVKARYGLAYEAKKEDFEINCDYHFGAYNNPVKEVREAIYYMGSKEGVIVDPCYTGKTFAGILRMAKNGQLAPGEKVIMMHTGGIPGIYTKHHRVEMEKELIGHIHVLK
ncbi:MAG: D-cysteine desulfhydrase family protein [Firmicutes bacterium]|nr:D-cysteine desulfhydrase family protein [Bacillota bacterium]